MVDKTIFLCYNRGYRRKEGWFGMIIANKTKALGKLKKEKAVVANQCTCSNCNCNCKFSLNNNLDDLTKVYREKLA